MKVATPQSLPDGDNSSAGMRVSTTATMKACSVAVSVSSGSASAGGIEETGAAVCAAAGPPVASAAVPTTAPLRKSRRGMVSSTMELPPLSEPDRCGQARKFCALDHQFQPQA